MIGWRARIGVLLPPDNAVLEHEVNRLPLPGVSFHVARMTATDLKELPENALHHVPSLKECGVNFILYACAASSFMFGSRSNHELEEKIRRISGLDVLTATSSMIVALKSLEAKQIALATPYTKELDDKLLEYFKSEKIGVSCIRSLGLESWEAINNQTQNAVYQLIKTADDPKADVILVLSTNLPTFDTIQILEDDLRKPVISTNQCMIWAACRKLGIRDSITGFGSLWARTHCV